MPKAPHTAAAVRLEQVKPQFEPHDIRDTELSNCFFWREKERKKEKPMFDKP